MKPPDRPPFQGLEMSSKLEGNHITNDGPIVAATSSRCDAINRESSNIAYIGEATSPDGYRSPP